MPYEQILKNSVEVAVRYRALPYGTVQNNVQVFQRYGTVPYRMVTFGKDYKIYVFPQPPRVILKGCENSPYRTVPVINQLI